MPTRTFVLAAAVCLALVAGQGAPLVAQQTGTAERPHSTEPHSAEPPGAMPWTKDFLAAHRQARRAELPIFLYSTKTH